MAIMGRGMDFTVHAASTAARLIGVVVLVTGTNQDLCSGGCAHAIKIYARDADDPNNAQMLINENANLH